MDPQSEMIYEVGICAVLFGGNGIPLTQCTNYFIGAYCAIPRYLHIEMNSLLAVRTDGVDCGFSSFPIHDGNGYCAARSHTVNGFLPFDMHLMGTGDAR